jgi:hypothetical protein
MKRKFRVLGLAVLAVAVATPAFASAVPELDPSIATSALILLVGGTISLIEWRRRK